MQPLYQRWDPGRGMVTQMLRDTDGSVVIVGKQKTDVITDFNARLRSMWDKHAMRGKPRMVAELPIQIYWHLQRLGITRDRDAFLRWLDRPDARHFRVDGGGRVATTRERSFAHVR